MNEIKKRLENAAIAQEIKSVKTYFPEKKTDEISKLKRSFTHTHTHTNIINHTHTDVYEKKSLMRKKCNKKFIKR